ncbi:hypothetical protein KKB73_01190 [Patescibacteria group bacterium]|nr:hypothetical protein [Patescibacteria group bacterium]
MGYKCFYKRQRVDKVDYTKLSILLSAHTKGGNEKSHAKDGRGGIPSSALLFKRTISAWKGRNAIWGD